MPADESLNPVQFSYRQVDDGGSTPLHKVEAHVPEEGRPAPGRQVGEMIWNRNKVVNISVPNDQQRQGIATRLWSHAQEVASSNAKIPAPKHSPDRTNAGGRLPRRQR